MQVTDVRIRKVSTGTRMVASASVTLDSEFVVHDIKIINSDRGLFIAMPSRKDAAGNYIDIAHPINGTAREKIQDAVLEAYNNLEE